MALKVPIRFRGDQSKSGLEAERIFDLLEWYKLHSRIDASLKIIIARALDSLELEAIEWLIMSKIESDETGEYTASRVAEDFDMNLSQATVLLKSLIKRNILRSKVSLKDRRVKYLQCTRNGKRLVYEGEEALQHAMRYWLFDLSDSEIQEHLIIMKKIRSFDIPQNFSD